MEIHGYLLYWLIYSFPLGGLGIYYLLNYQIVPRLRNSMGHVKVKQLLPNGRWKNFWAKPEEENTTEGEIAFFFKKGDKRFTFIDAPGAVYQDGPVKEIYYDVEGNQINISKITKYVPAVSPKLLDSLLKRIWNAARASAVLNEKTLRIMLIFAIIAATAATLIGIISLQNTVQVKAGITEIINTLTKHNISLGG